MQANRSLIFKVLASLIRKELREVMILVSNKKAL